MKHRLLFTALCAGLLCAGMLASCREHTNEPGESAPAPTDTTASVTTDTSEPVTTVITAPETTAPETTVSETTVPESTVPATTAPETTAMPRYDYIGQTVGDRVTIDKADYDGLTLTVAPDLEVTPEVVQEYIGFICFEYRRATDAGKHQTDIPMKRGDNAYIYFRGTIDGKLFEGGSNWEAEKPYELALGSGSFIPGFEDQLIGVTPQNTSREKTVTVQATFPADYHKPELAGKQAVFAVYVVDSVAYEIPAYTRDFVENTLKYEAQKDFYASDRAYLDEFEEFVKKTLESRVESEIQKQKNQKFREYVLAHAEVRDVPAEELTFYYTAFREEVESQYEVMQKRYGTEFLKKYPTIERFAADYLGIEDGSQWDAYIRDLADENVRYDMILFAIAEKENLKAVTDAEYKAELDELVRYYQGYMTAEQIEKTLGRDAIRRSVVMQKVDTFVEEHTKVAFGPQASA